MPAPPFAVSRTRSFQRPFRLYLPRFTVYTALMFAALSRLSALLSFFTEPLGAISSTVGSPRFGYATWTSTFAAREALPAHAVTATAETAVPRSRMAASVPLARTLHGW